jgi:hypothetical protein
MFFFQVQMHRKSLGDPGIFWKRRMVNILFHIRGGFYVVYSKDRGNFKSSTYFILSDVSRSSFYEQSVFGIRPDVLWIFIFFPRTPSELQAMFALVRANNSTSLCAVVFKPIHQNR